MTWFCCLACSETTEVLDPFMLYLSLFPQLHDEDKVAVIAVETSQSTSQSDSIVRQMNKHISILQTINHIFTVVPLLMDTSHKQTLSCGANHIQTLHF